jgi:hypothetical protein
MNPQSPAGTPDATKIPLMLVAYDAPTILPLIGLTGSTPEISMTTPERAITLLIVDMFAIVSVPSEILYQAAQCVAAAVVAVELYCTLIRFQPVSVGVGDVALMLSNEAIAISRFPAVGDAMTG